MILSASGWRKVFAESMDAEDTSPKIGEANSFLCLLIAETFAEYIISKTGKKKIRQLLWQQTPAPQEKKSRSM